MPHLSRLAIVIPVSSPLSFPFPRRCPAPCSPPALSFSSMVVVVVLVMVMVVVLVMVMVLVLVLPSSLVVQLEHPQPPCEQMLAVVGRMLGCCSLVPPSLVGLVLSFPCLGSLLLFLSLLSHRPSHRHPPVVVVPSFSLLSPCSHCPLIIILSSPLLSSLSLVIIILSSSCPSHHG